MSRISVHRAAVARIFSTRRKSSLATSQLEEPLATGIKSFEEIPGPRSLPLIGATWVSAIHRDPFKMANYMRNKYGNIILLRNLMGVGDAVITFDVSDIKVMFRNEGVWPIRCGFNSTAYYRNVVRKDIFGEVAGLLTSNHQPWADFRSKVNPILMQPRTALQYIASINEIADEFIERTREFMHESPVNEMPADYLDELHKWALESIAMIALDTRLGCIDKNPSEESHKMVMYMLDIFRMTYTLDFSPLTPFAKKFNLPIWRRFVEHQDFITNKVLSFIEDAIKKVENDPFYAQKSESEKSAFEKLRAKGKILSVVMTLDMLTAGIDTTGKISAATLYFLATNKHVQEKLRAEVRKALPSSSDVITKDSLDQLPYLRAVIKEAMRMAPVVSANIREMSKDVQLGGYHVPKGVSVIAPHMYLSYSEEHYKNPYEFRPERWMRGDAQSELKTASPFVSMPFGFGPRSCIGRRLANLELEILITKMVKNFDISWNHKPMTFVQELLYGVKDPLQLQLTPLSIN